jgi:D-alanyl-D-alanine carboxypeptidase
MPHRTALLIVGLASIAIGPRAVVGQPHAGPAAAADLTRDWPKPELRAGLSDAQIAASIAAYAKQLHDARHFSGVVLAARAGKIVVSGAYGLANIAANTPNTLDTRFNIGSLNKLFTRVAIAQLAEAGRLSLDDTLRTHLPQLPVPGADRISIRQLLEHRSGMGDIFGPRYDAAPPSRLRELDDFVPLFADQPLAFEPGSSERYSNAGYVTLGLIVERLTGEKYRDYVSRHIFAPAHMASTGLWALDERVPERATGYTRHGKDRELDELVPNTDRLPGRPSSAGGAFATAGDLLRFWDAVLAGKLLSARWTNWVVNGSFDDAGRTPALGLGGGAPGVNASIEINGAWTVIALANLDPPSAMAVTRGAMQIIRAQRADDRPDDPAIHRRAPSAPGRTELGGDVAVPTAMSGHLLTVEARVNGKGPFRFVVDTGSGGMLRITRAVQDALGLEPLGVARVGDPSGKNMVNRPIVRASSVEIGGARFLDVNATVGDQLGGNELSGVIGLSLFANLTATLDYRKHELRLSRRPLAPGDAHVVAFTAERGVPVIDIEVAGAAMKVDVDTGSPAVLSVPSSWATALRFAGQPTTRKGRTATNEFEIRTAELRDDIRVAGFTQASPRVDVVDLFPVANLGAQFLRQYTVTFDLANHRMALAR